MSILDWFRPRRKPPLQITSAADLEAALPFGLVVNMRQDPGDLEKRSAATSETTPSGLKGQPIPNELRLEDAIRSGYTASTWTYACMWRRAVSAGSVPWIVEDADGGDWQPKEEDHPLKDLVEEPNPYWGFQDMVEMTSLFLDGGGDCLMTVVRDGSNGRKGRPRELYPISPDHFFPVSGGETELISHYELRRDGRRVKTVVPSDAIHFKLPHPLNPWRGLSTIQAGCRSVDIDTQASKFQFSAFKNQAVPSGAVLLNRPLSDAQMKDAEARLQEKFTGPDNARKLFVFGNAANWARLSLSPQEMDFLNSRGFGLTEIAALFMTPPPMIGWYEKATLSNIQESRKIYWLDNLTMWLGRIRRTMNRWVWREFPRERIRLNYDLRQVDALISVRAENEKRARNLWEMGVPFNQCNRELALGFRPIPGGDIPYIPANVVPEGMLPAGAQSNGNGLPILEE